jgi:hypothetical protein
MSESNATKVQSAAHQSERFVRGPIDLRYGFSPTHELLLPKLPGEKTNSGEGENNRHKLWPRAEHRRRPRHSPSASCPSRRRSPSPRRGTSSTAVHISRPTSDQAALVHPAFLQGSGFTRSSSLSPSEMLALPEHWCWDSG